MTPRERAQKLIDEVISYDEQIGDITKAETLNNGRWHSFHYDPVVSIEAAITAAVEAEREACAQICEDRRVKDRAHWAQYKEDTQSGFILAEELRDAIRARTEATK